MSKNAKGILGQQVGKVGPVVGRLFRGEIIYSAYQPVVGNPKTNAQLVHRAKFAAVSATGHAFGCATRLGFGRAVAGTKYSPRNLFAKLNQGAFTASTPESVVVSYPNLVIAAGGLCPVSFDVPSFAEPLKVSVNYVDGVNGCQKTPSDKVYLVAFAPDMNQAVVSTGEARDEGTIELEVPSTWNGLKVHVWGFVRNDGQLYEPLQIPAGECSGSTYVGTGTIG